MSEIKIRFHSAAQSRDQLVHWKDPARLTSMLSKSFLDEENLTSFQRQAHQWTNDLLGSDSVTQLESLPEGCLIEIKTDQLGHLIPWEALIVGNEFWGSRFAIRRILEKQQEADSERSSSNDNPPSASTIVVADAPELIHYGHELPAVRGILRQLATQNPDQLAAPTSNLMDTDVAGFLQQLNTCGWLHFIGHTRKIAGARCLKLSPDEIVGPNEIIQTEKAPHVVFLSACAALEIPRKISSASDRETILTTLIERGTKCLAGPTLPFGDHECRQVVTTFYESILNGCTPAESMRLARINAIQSNRCRIQVALSFVVYQQDGYSLSPQSPGSLTMNKFPLVCAGCGKTIETRHGLGDAGWQDATMCRECCRTGRTASVLADAGPPTDYHDSTAKAAAEEQTLSTTTESNSYQRQVAIDDFRQIVLDSLESFDHWEDFETGETRTCEVITASQLRENQRVLDHVPPARRPSSADWTESFLIVPDANANPPKTKPPRTKLDKVDEASPFIARLTVSQVSAIDQHPGVSEQQVQNLLNEFLHTPDSKPHVIVVATLDKFDRRAKQMLSSSNQKNWRELKNVCLILFEAGEHIAHYDPQDTRAYNLLGFLQKHGREEQFEITLNWVASQLPLVASLGSRPMAEEKDFHEPTVRKAFRVAAHQFGLRVDDTEEFGLVISAD